MDDTSVLMILIIIGSHVSLDHKDGDPDHCHEDMKTFLRMWINVWGRGGFLGAKGVRSVPLGGQRLDTFCVIWHLCVFVDIIHSHVGAGSDGRISDNIEDNTATSHSGGCSQLLSRIFSPLMNFEFRREGKEQRTSRNWRKRFLSCR